MQKISATLRRWRRLWSLPTHSPESTKIRTESFVQQLIAAAEATLDANERLKRLAALSDRLLDLQNDYGVPCKELDIVSDAMNSALHSAPDDQLVTDTVLMLRFVDNTSALQCASRQEFWTLAPSLRRRIIMATLPIIFDELAVDPVELEPCNQAAFLALESEGLRENELQQALQARYGIAWRTRRQMNPALFE
jgi:hypothetical protein